MATVPSVSVVVPVYNGARTIGRCLESLLAQDYPAGAYEVIVVENCSTDDTADIVRRYPVRLVQSNRRGPAPARNLGIEHSTAAIVAFTDADCIVDRSWLRHLIAPYTNPDVGGTGGPINSFAGPERTHVEVFSDTIQPLVNYSRGDETEFLPFLATCNCSYRRDLLLQIGCFNERLVTADDIDVSWRIQLETGRQIALAEGAVIEHQHRQTVTGLRRQFWQYGFGEILLDTLYGTYPDYPRSHRFALRRTWGQVRVLPRYAASIVLRQLRYRRGKITSYEATLPALNLVIEGSCILGKLDALIATRGMRNINGLLKDDTGGFIDRMYQR